MTIKYLDDFYETQLPYFLLKKIKGKWFVEDTWGRRYFGIFNKSDAIPYINEKIDKETL